MTLKENWSRTKEVLGAYFRHGMHELGAVFYGHGTAAQPAEYGMLATRTPGQVADGLRASNEPAPVQQPDKSTPAPSPLQTQLDQSRERAEHTPQPERDDRALERE